MIPAWTRADNGSTTLGGAPAVFRSSTQAWIALRLVYVAEVAGHTPAQVAQRTTLYRQGWDRYSQHLHDMQRIAALVDDDLTAAAALWNSIDQCAANDAFTSMLCEREPFPKVNLATVAQRHFGLIPSTTNTTNRDRKVNARDHQAAWEEAPGGRCRSCGNPTVAQRQHDRLRRIMRAHPELFDLTPTYEQKSGAIGPLWSARLLIAAKGVADHITPWSQEGPTSADNLANVCAACNYSRNDASLEDIRIAAFA